MRVYRTVYCYGTEVIFINSETKQIFMASFSMSMVKSCLKSILLRFMLVQSLLVVVL